MASLVDTVRLINVGAIPISEREVQPWAEVQIRHEGPVVERRDDLVVRLYEHCRVTCSTLSLIVFRH